MITKFYQAILILLCSASAGHANNVDTYIKEYGLAEESQRVVRAHEIFDTLKRSTNHLTGATSLAIIDSETTPWASALPDGNIVLSKGALDVVYKESSDDLAEARLAFILGHELAHQFNGDHYHEKLREIRISASGKFLRRSEEDVRSSHDREIRADISGFIYASVAGFRTDLILPEPDGEGGFFHYWVNQTGTQDGDKHPAALERTKTLAHKLADIDLNYFKYGSRLAHFGRFEMAHDLLRKFERPFPSKESMNIEVLSILGYTNILKSYSMQDLEDRYRFWMPTLLETDIRFPEPKKLNRRSLNIDDSDRKKVLEEAIIYLDSAVKMDPWDLASNTNLIIANMLSGNFGTAGDKVTKAMNFIPDSGGVLEHLRSIVSYAGEFESKQSVDIRESVEALEQRLMDDKTEPYVLYNLARILQEQGYFLKATGLWLKLYKDRQHIPVEYLNKICTEIGQICDAAPVPKDDESTRRYFAKIPVVLGQTIESTITRENLASWSGNGPVNPAGSGARVLVNGDDSILVVDQVAEMAVLGPDSHGFKNSEQLLEMLGQPVISTVRSGSSIWSYGQNFSAKIEQDKVSEVWLSYAPLSAELASHATDSNN